MTFNTHLLSLVTTFLCFWVGGFCDYCKLGSLIFGMITDRFGRKIGIVVSTFGLCVGNYVLCKVIMSRQYWMC